MEDLLSLNSSNSVNQARVKKFDSLEVGEYIVKSFKLKETNFGLRVYVEIDDFYLSLPPRFSDKINSAEQIDDINDKKFKMIYKGKNPEEFNKLMIDFELVKVHDAQIIEDEDEIESTDEEFEFTRKINKRKVEENIPKIQYSNKKLRMQNVPPLK